MSGTPAGDPDASGDASTPDGPGTVEETVGESGASPRPADDPFRTTPFRAWSSDWRPRSALVVLVLVAATFGLTAGLPGLAVGIALTVAWFALPTVAVFAAGTIAHAAVVPRGAPLGSTVLPMLALAGLLFVTTISADRLRDWGVLAVAWLGLGGLVAIAWVLTETVWVAGLTLAVAGLVGFVSVAYFGLQRVGVTDE